MTMKPTNQQPLHPPLALDVRLILFNQRLMKAPCPCRWDGCSECFMTPSDLLQHVLQSHILSPPSLHSGASLGVHPTTLPHHATMAMDTHQNNQTACHWEDCNQPLPSINSAMEHLNRHARHDPYRCNANGCTDRFPSVASLQHHALVHGHKGFVCTYLGTLDKVLVVVLM
jgi:hypothetical protein